MTKAEIMTKLRDIFKLAVSDPQIDPENITLDCNLTTDLGMTSMGLLYLVIAVEESFDIRFDDVGLADFATVSDVVDYIEGKI
jgi:acyl carrier protein